MPDSKSGITVENTPGGRVHKASFNIFLLFVIFFIFASTFSWFSKQYAYFRYYNFIPGQFTGHQIMQLQKNKEKDLCLIMGASTAREGFDSEVLNKTNKNLHIANLATTAGFGSLGVLDIQSLIAKNQASHFECIILAIHPFFLRYLDEKSYDIKTNNYESQLSLVDYLNLIASNKATSTHDITLFLKAIFIPNAKHSKILRKHLYRLVFELKTIISGNVSELSNYEITPNDLVIAETSYLYLDKPSRYKTSLNKIGQILFDEGLEDVESYKSPASKAVFEEILRRLGNIANRLIVIDLPTSTAYHNAWKLSVHHYLSIITKEASGAEIYKCSFPPQESKQVFHDAIHVNERGRNLLTNELVQILNRSSKNKLCKKL